MKWWLEELTTKTQTHEEIQDQVFLRVFVVVSSSFQNFHLLISHRFGWYEVVAGRINHQDTKARRNSRSGFTSCLCGSFLFFPPIPFIDITPLPMV
jgi:hypothetical protein